MLRAAAGGFLYCDPEGYELRSEIAVRHGVDLENVVLGAGIDELLMMVVHAFVGVGDPVVTSLGGYPTFEYAVAGRGGMVERVPYVEEGLGPSIPNREKGVGGRWIRVDLQALGVAAQRVKAKLVYLSNPDNPSGSWHDAHALTAFRQSLPEESLLVLDEAYADFVPQGELVETIAKDSRIVRLRTFSKAHGMAGLRVGYAIGDSDLVATLNKIRLHFGVNIVAQAGALASLRDPDHVAEVVRQTDIGRKKLIGGATQLGIPCLESRTNFVCLDLGSRNRAEKTMQALLERQIFVRKPGQPPLDRCIRVTIGPAQQIESFLKELGETLT